jgi:hypothetical protein
LSTLLYENLPLWLLENLFYGFRFVLNTSATHHNPIICTSKKQNARPAKQLQFNRKIFGGKFRARILNQLNQKQKRKRRRLISQKAARNLMTNFARNFRETKIFQFHLRHDRKKPSKIPIRTIPAQLKHN